MVFNDLRKALHGLDEENYRKARAEVIRIIKAEDSSRRGLAVMRSDLMVDDKVSFKARGQTWVGRVDKVNRTTLTVMATTKGSNGVPVMWRVSPEFVKKVE